MDSVYLRLPQLSDLNFFRYIELNPENKIYSDIEEILDEDLLRDFILSDHSLEKYQQIRLVVIAENEPAGFADLYDSDRETGEVWIGIIIDMKKRHKGIGSRTLQLAESKAREFGFHTLSARVHILNLPALRLFSSNDYSINENDQMKGKGLILFRKNLSQ